VRLGLEVGTGLEIRVRGRVRRERWGYTEGEKE
jgi:hypothetical protein